MGSIIDIKSQMMVDPNIVYLNHASIGPLPRQTYEIIQAGFDTQAKYGERKIDYKDIEEIWISIIQNVAQLLNGFPEGVAVTNNTAMGFHIVADGLFSYFKEHEHLTGRNIVIPEIEFVTNSYVWQQLARRYSLEFRTVPMINGRLPVEAFEPFIDDQTLLVSISYVQFSNGYRANLKAIAELAHQHGAYLVVDAIQGLGVVPLDVKYTDVDFVAAAGYKWLLGPLGSGIFYGKPELVETMETIMVGWFSSSNYRELQHNEFTPFNDARKFQQSMINPVINGLDSSIQTLLDWGIHNNYTKIIKLQNIVIKRIAEIDQFSIHTSLRKDERSGIINLTLKDDSKGSTKHLVKHLVDNNITVAYRNGLRVSPHSYNTEQDIHRFLDEIIEFSNK